MNINPLNFLPVSLQKTRWADIIQVFWDLMNDIKVEKIDLFKTQWELENMTDERIIELASIFGYEISSYEGYTSTTDYLRKEFVSLIPRILNRTTTIGYDYIFKIFNLNGNVYPTYFNSYKDNLIAVENWDTENEHPETYNYLDAGGPVVLFSIPWYINDMILNQGYPIEYRTPIFNTHRLGTLETTTLDEMDIFPHLDMLPYTETMSRHIIVSYNFKYIESPDVFISQNTALAFYNDMVANKRKTEILYFEPNIKIDTLANNNLTTKDYYKYDNTISSSVKSILIGSNLSNVSRIVVGIGNNSPVNNTITKVKFPTVDLSMDDFDILSNTENEFIGRINITPKSKWESGVVKEIALYDDGNNCIYYATFPSIYFSNKMYTNLRFEIKLY